MDHLREVIIPAGHDSANESADEEIEMPDRLSIRSLRHASEDISVAPLMSIPLLLGERGLDASTVLERIGVEPGIFDDVANRLPFDVAGLNAAFGNALDWRFINIDEFNVGLIVDLVIACLKRHSACPETMVLRDQLFCDSRIVYSLTNLLGDKL